MSSNFTTGIPSSTTSVADWASIMIAINMVLAFLGAALQGLRLVRKSKCCWGAIEVENSSPNNSLGRSGGTMMPMNDTVKNK